MNFLVIFLFLFLSSIFLLVNTESSTCVSDCPDTKCSDDGGFVNSPVIRFPFRARELQPRSSCGLSGFELSCKQNKSFIHFGSYYGDLEVKSISYEEKILNLVDPKNCVHEVFLNLNLSGTPFRYYYVLKQYTYLNCSVKLPVPSFTQVPCLSSAPHSNHHHHVYIVEPSLSSVPDSCTPLKTIGIPFSYSPYISDNSFGLRLSWDSTDDQEKHVQSDDIETNGTPMRRSWIDIIYYKVLGLAMFIFMVMTLAFLKTSYLDEENDKELKKQNPIEAQTLLRDSATLGV